MEFQKLENKNFYIKYNFYILVENYKIWKIVKFLK